MNENVQEKIKELLKEAMKNGNEAAKLTYRALLTSFMNKLVSTGKKPQDLITNEEALAVIRQEIKKREDSIKQYISAARAELAQIEKDEVEILNKFLPPQLSEEEISKKVSEILEKVKPLDIKMVGKYIGMCVKELKDVANGDKVKEIVEKMLK